MSITKSRSLLKAIEEALTAGQEKTDDAVLTVEREPDYWSGGHFHEGYKPWIDPVKVWRLPIGTKLYQASQMAAPQEEANLFVRHKDTTFVRHDKIVITQDSLGVISAEFSWRGVHTHTMHTQCDLKAGQVLTLAGLEGQMAIKVWSSS